MSLLLVFPPRRIKKGWAIFVCSPGGKIYSNSHIVGYEHHSSFLDGGSVRAAGEISVDRGCLQVITAKSGHYRPDPATMHRFVLEFGQIHADTVIRPDVRNDQYFRVGDFRTNFLGATPLTRSQIIRKTPPFARSVQAMQSINQNPP